MTKVFFARLVHVFVASYRQRGREQAVDKIFFQAAFEFFVEFAPRAVEHLDAVEFGRIVRGADHHAAIGGVALCEIRARGGGKNAAVEDVSAAHRHARRNGEHEHIRGNAVIARDKIGRLCVQSAKRVSERERRAGSQTFVDDAADPVRSESVAHFSSPPK